MIPTNVSPISKLFFLAKQFSRSRLPINSELNAFGTRSPKLAPFVILNENLLKTDFSSRSAGKPAIACKLLVELGNILVCYLATPPYRSALSNIGSAMKKIKVGESSLYCSYKQHYIRNKQLHIQISEIVALQSLAEIGNFRDL